MALPASGAAQTTHAPSAITRTVIAATKLPTVTDVPLHFKAVSITLQPDERSSVSAANGILYQMSGSTEVALDGEAKMLNAGEGLFIAGGKTAALTAGSGVPSTFLHFSLARSVRSSQPFRKQKRPNRSKREKDNSSTRQEGKRKMSVHDIFPRDKRDDRVQSRFDSAANLVSAQLRFFR